MFIVQNIVILSVVIQVL